MGLIAPAKAYRPAHGGYPTCRRRRRGGRHVAGAGSVQINVCTPPPTPSFGAGLAAGYEAGLHDGRRGK